MTGNIGVEGGGARYGHLHTRGFNYNAMLQKPPVGAIGIPERRAPPVNSGLPLAATPCSTPIAL